VIALEATILERFRSVLNYRLDAAMIRCHGDLHLDQILVVDGGIVFIDFEGEPKLSVGERQLKRSPLRDVATMLRSFQEAASDAQDLFVERAGAGSDTPRTHLEPWAHFWELWVGAAFLRAYLRQADGAPFVPVDREQAAILLDTFLLERSLNELDNALRSHPSRAASPLVAILRLIGTRAEVGSAE
jgi:maltose alpha-D-glucosyltransferase/alpha-amylase